MKIRRTLELGLFCALYIGAVVYIHATSPERESRTDPILITDIQATIAEVPDHAPTILEELPIQPPVEVSRRRDPEPPAVPPVIVTAVLTPEPAKPAKPEPAKNNPQPVLQQPQQRQCQPVCQPDPACERRGLGGLLERLSPFSR